MMPVYGAAFVLTLYGLVRTGFHPVLRLLTLASSGAFTLELWEGGWFSLQISLLLTAFVGLVWLVIILSFVKGR